MDRKKNNVKKIINDYIKHLPANIKIEGVFLFGSYATGKAKKDSDIDIAVISPNFEKTPFIKRLEMLSKFRKTKMSRSAPMDIIGYTPYEFRNIDKRSIIMRRAKKEGEMIIKN